MRYTGVNAAYYVEWHIYLHSTTKQDVVTFWRAVEDRLPKTGGASETFVDVDRSFSKSSNFFSPVSDALVFVFLSVN